MSEVYDPSKSRKDLLVRGEDLAQRFCTLNKLHMPAVQVTPSRDWRFDACAYYRPVYIAICVEKCAPLGKAGRAWSWPGNVIDRTPYGVIQHELGHHVDHTFSKDRGAYFGDYSQGMRGITKEPPLTGYCPNDAEWFAEIFRLFVTNPDLLRLLRPRAFAALSDRLRPAVTEPWEKVLADAPIRTLVSCENKIKKVPPTGLFK